MSFKLNRPSRCTDRTGRPRASVWGLWLAAALLLGGCAGDERPSLIFIIMDTTRFDRFGCTGYAEATTATLDSLAAAGVRFDCTVTATPVTGPAITTILSSVPPAIHGVRDNRRFAINPKVTLLAQVFAEAGYQTGAVVGAVPLLARFGYDRGFASYDDRFAEDPYPIHTPGFASPVQDLRESERRATAVTDRALRWLDDASRRKPFFLLAHYFDPHGPYDPPPEFAALHPADPYDGEIAYMNSEIGRLLAGVRARLGARAKVRVVAVADHGEGLFDHDEMGHGFFLYETTIRVPWIVNGEGVVPGLVVQDAVRTVDIAPTVCAWFGLPLPESFTGQDLSSVLTGGAVPAACDTAFIETFWTQLHYSWAPLQGVRTSQWKWIRAPRPELYQLRADPAETSNLAGGGQEAEGLLDAWLERFLTAAAAAHRTFGAPLVDVDPDLDRKLQALGYVSGQENSSLVPDMTLPDPKDGNGQWNRSERRLQHLQDARRYFEHGKLSAALRRLEMAAAIEPLARQEAALMGLLLSRAGRIEEALAQYGRALQSETEPEGRALVRMEMIRQLIALDRYGDARSQIDTLRSEPAVPARILSAIPQLEAQIKARGP
jgi:choline-sulfatase